MANADALVINLDRSPGRWKATSRALRGIGLAVERVRAIDAADMAPPDEYDVEANRRGYFAPLKATEIACFRSHRKAWMRVVELGRPMLICEDDVAVADDTGPVILALAMELRGPIAVKLYAKRTVRGVSRSLPERSLVTPRVVPLGCVAVWLTPEGAAGLLEHSQRFHLPVDVYTQMTWVHGVETHAVVPPPVSEVSEQLGGTTLAAPRAPFAARLAREVRRPLFRTRLAVRSLLERR